MPASMTSTPTTTPSAAPVPRAPAFVALGNVFVARLLRLGIPFGPMVLLTVRGRKSGQPRTTPVGLFKHAARRYLFSTFGEVNWVRNLRAAGEATVGRGRRRERVAVVELPHGEAAIILKDVIAPYLKVPVASSVLRPHLTVAPNAPLADFIAQAQRHPIFEMRAFPADPTPPR